MSEFIENKSNNIYLVSEFVLLGVPEDVSVRFKSSQVVSDELGHVCKLFWGLKEVRDIIKQIFSKLS